MNLSTVQTILERFDALSPGWPDERLIAVAEPLELHVRRLPPEGRSRLALYAVMGDVLGEGHQALRMELLRSADGEALKGLLHARGHAELSPWRLLPDEDGAVLKGRRAVGPGSENVFELSGGVWVPPETGESPAHFYLGWSWVDDAGERLLITLAPLDSAGLRRVERLGVRGNLAGEVAPWVESRDELVRIALDPHNHCQPMGAYPPESLIGEIPEVERLLHDVLAKLNTTVTYASPWNHRFHRFKRTRWARESIAKARSAAGLKSLIKAIRGLRYHLLSYSERLFLQAFDIDEPILDSMLPVERVLEALGCAPDATMAEAAPELLARHPMGVLGLPPDHPIWERHHPREAIQLALSWSRRSEDKTVPEAFRVYEQEQRWLATFSGMDLSEARHRERTSYEELGHGLHHLFDGRVLELPLGELPVDGRVSQRLVKALGASATIRDLPRKSTTLLRKSGVGPSTLEALLGGLLERARTWRQDMAQLTIAPALQQAQTVESAKTSLSEGLDELAALFGGE